MADPIVAKRLVLHVGGYDLQRPEDFFKRFRRELQRFEKTWSVQANATDAGITPDRATLSVVASGPNWQVGTQFHVLPWNDLMVGLSRRPPWRRVASGLLACLDFIQAGALLGYFRTNWRYGLFFLYPLALLAVFVGVAWGLGALVAAAAGSRAAGAVAGIAGLAFLVREPGRRLYLLHLFDDWDFSRDYVRHGDPVLDRRLDEAAQTIVSAQTEGRCDEILVVGHSLGAVLAVDLLDRALSAEPRIADRSPPVRLVSIGSSILKIGLHREARRFRAALERVASSGVLWAEYQALSDPMNFYKVDPTRALRLPTVRPPVIRTVRFSRMLQPERYRRIRRSFFRLHNQFVSGNDRRAAYDYFLMVCGPVPVQRLVAAGTGGLSFIGPQGHILDPAAAPEHGPDSPGVPGP